MSKRLNITCWYPLYALERLRAITPQESKKRLQDEISEHMAAHQAQVKAARARVKRDELNRLGAKFAVQLHQKGSESSQGQVCVLVCVGGGRFCKDGALCFLTHFQHPKQETASFV